MKNIFNRPSSYFYGPHRLYKTRENEPLIEELSQNIKSTKSPDFDQKVRDNINNIVQKVDAKEAAQILDKNLSREQKENAEKLIEREQIEAENTPSPQRTPRQKPRLGGLKKAVAGVGTHIGVGAKYGALIMGGITAIIAVPYGLATAGAAGMGVGAMLGVATLSLLAGGVVGAIDGAINGAIIGGIIGLVRKAIDKKENAAT